MRALNEIAARRGQTLAQMALAWMLRDPRMTSALIGASSVEQLETNVAALDRLDFDADELAEIDRYATEAGHQPLGAVERDLEERAHVSAIEELERQRIVPVLRCRDAEDTLATARAAASAGCRVVELTMSTPGVEDAIAPLVADGLIVAVGMVRRRPTCLDSTSPSRRSSSRSGIHPASSRPDAAGIQAIPGAFTPRARRRPCGGRDGCEALPRVARRDELPPRASPAAPRAAPARHRRDPAGRRAPWLDAGALAVGLGSNLGTAATDGAGEVERRCRAALAAAS